MSTGTGNGAADVSSPTIIHPSHVMSAEAGSSLTLSPPNLGRSMSISPGAMSDLSNEAAAGHGGGNAKSNNFASFAQQGHATSPTMSVSTPRVTRGGFDQDQSALLTPMGDHSIDADELDSAPSYPVHPPYPGQDRGIGNANVAGPSTSTTLMDSNGSQTHPSASHSLGSFSQLTGTSATAITEEVIPTTFDEATLRALCDLDVSQGGVRKEAGHCTHDCVLTSTQCGMPLLYDRIKQSMLSANQASLFFKKRAAIEEEYARNLIKLAKSTYESYGTSEAKAG